MEVILFIPYQLFMFLEYFLFQFHRRENYFSSECI